MESNVLSIFLLAAVVGDQPLWKDLVPGMSKEQVEAKYPTGKVMLTPSCEAKVITRFKNGGLSLVALRFGDLMAAGRDQWNAAISCQETVKASIIEKYGAPIDQRFVKTPGSLAGKDQYTFSNDTVSVTFTVERNRPFTVVQYELVPIANQVSPDAAQNL